MRTKLGDVEINDPNLLYHTDAGDHIGAFSNRGAYVKEGKLYPGQPKKDTDIGYSWWNKGKTYTKAYLSPYDTGEGEVPISRLMTTTVEDAPSMLHVRSQKYPIGQWNGRSGFVTKSEYVSPEPVDISNSTYIWEPNYGWRKAEQEPSTISWEEALDTPTNNLLKWLDKPMDYKPNISVLNAEGAPTKGSVEEKLMNILELNGVDISRLSREDLTKALEYRMRDIETSAPERYTLVKAQSSTLPEYVLEDINSGNKVGNTSVQIVDDGNVYISNTENLTRNNETPTRQVFERALNSSINLANTFGGKGVITGKQYLSAPRQINVVNKYGDREIIGNTGTYNNYRMSKTGSVPGKQVFSPEEMVEVGDNYPAYAYNMPISLLTKPTFITPTKSNLFEPTIIDSSGKMNIEWSNPNVLRGIIYPTFGSTLLYNSFGND